MMRRSAVLFLLAGCLSSGLTFARTPEPSHVVIDPTDEHTTVFLSVPQTAPAEALDKLKDNLKTSPKASLITWEAFKQNASKIVQAHIRRNDYPGVDVTTGLARLMEHLQGAPFGLTWNGGLAITGNDFRHSARSYMAFVADPSSFRPPERSSDPVHPLNHMEPLLRR
jgi:hypothetical protein